MGGTFDYLHNGHKILLVATFLLTEIGGKILIGLTGESLLKNKKNK